jgi:glycolate oxidase
MTARDGKTGEKTHLDREVVNHVRRIVGKDNCSDRREDLFLYAYDGMNRRYLPDMVAHPLTAEEISAIMKLANEKNFPLIPRGAGSGLTGGSLPVDGGIVVTTQRLNRILEIDEDNMTVWVQAGVLNVELQEEVAKKGLLYPPDPASMNFSTIGGNAAENAGGPHAVKYGVTRDYVLALEVVLPTGEVLQTGSKAIKSVTGYDLTRLIVGSEGTLGFITKLLLRLVPAPEAVKTLLIAFPGLEMASKAVARIMASRVIPSTLEFMDRSAVDCVRDYLDFEIPENTSALLLVEVDGRAESVEREAEILEKVCRELGAGMIMRASSQAESDSMWKARRSISPAIMKIRRMKINEDVSVPRMNIPGLITGIEEISARHRVKIVNFGHAGDGNVHVNVLVDPEDLEEVARGNEAVGDIFRLAVSLGGSLTGEHGIGIAKAPYLGVELPQAAVQVMRSIKRAMDPNNILNPHKSFDFNQDCTSREIPRAYG